MKITLFGVPAALLCCLALPHAAQASQFGVYRGLGGHLMYVGTEHMVPAKPFDQYYDAVTSHIGDARSLPRMRQILNVSERRLLLKTDGSQLGASIWYASQARRATIVLIHGNAPETREIGYLIPFFTSHGMTVVTYDQRGTGQSSGSWSDEGPPDRAHDVLALVAAIKQDPHVDPHAIGLWAISNGGWTAPIVAESIPVAFMILNSAPAETLQDNIVYEVEQRMQREHYSRAQIAAAAETDRSALSALLGHTSWSAAHAKYTYAKSQRWFADTELPSTFPMPPPPTLAAAFRRAAVFDPTPFLLKVKTPTIAFFGALDRNVNVQYSIPAFARFFRISGMRDFTERVYMDAGHTLEVSKTGYIDDPAPPRRVVPYLPATIEWLRSRHFAT